MLYTLSYVKENRKELASTLVGIAGSVPHSLLVLVFRVACVPMFGDLRHSLAYSVVPCRRANNVPELPVYWAGQWCQRVRLAARGRLCRHGQHTSFPVTVTVSITSVTLTRHQPHHMWSTRYATHISVTQIPGVVFRYLLAEPGSNVR